MKPQSPCKDCKDRYLGYHSSCQQYQDFVVEGETYRKKLRESHKNYDYMFRSIQRNKKKRGK